MVTLSADQLAEIAADLRPMRDYLMALQARSIAAGYMRYAVEVEKAAGPVCDLVNLIERGHRQQVTAAILAKMRSAEPAGDPHCGADRRS